MIRPIQPNRFVHNTLWKPSDITLKHLQHCVQILWEDKTLVAHNEALQALEMTMNIVRKLQEEENE